MGIMVCVPVSVLIMAAAPGERGASRRVAANTSPYSKEGHSTQSCLNASDQTSEQFDRTQEFAVEMDLTFKKQSRMQHQCVNRCDIQT